jgi:hypothetical protein
MLPLLLLGTLIREVLAPFTGHPFDFELWIRDGYYVSQGEDPYLPTNPVPNLSIPGTNVLPSIGYPPVWPFVNAAIYLIYSHLGINDRFLYYFMLKQPMIAGDLIAALLIHRIVLGESGNGVLATKAARFWLFCPYTIIISSVWGQFDQLALDLILVSILLVRKTSRGALVEASGILLKAIPIIFLPIFSLLQDRDLKRKILYALTTLLVVLGVSVIPFVFPPKWSFPALFGAGTAEVLRVGTSVNYWMILYAYSAVFNGTLSSWEILFVEVMEFAWIPSVLLASFLVVRRFKKAHIPITTGRLVLASLFVLMIFYLTRTRITEQYVIYFIGLGIIYEYISIGQLTWRFHVVWLSAFVFIVVNNEYLVPFLSPLSERYQEIGTQLNAGFLQQLNIMILVSCGILFTTFSSVYTKSLLSKFNTDQLSRV